VARRCLRKSLLVGSLFFVMVADVRAEDVPADETRVAMEALRAQNQSLREELQQREALVRVLTENLAIARTESELFQRRWAEVQLRAQTMGGNFRDPTVAQAQRQVLETVRSLYFAEAERQRLLEQLKELTVAVAAGQSATGELMRAQSLIAASEQPRAREVAAEAGAPQIDSAKVLDANPNLRVVVLNVGEAQGARVGMPFIVLRGDRVVAELRVVEVRRNICGAVVERLDKDVTLAAGDAARVTKS